MTDARRVRRLRHVFVRFGEAPMLDLAALLDGRVDIERENRVMATSLAADQSHPLTRDELGLLAEIAEDDWTATASLVGDDPARQRALDGLLTKAMVVADDALGAQLLRRAERLASTEWFPGAALYHYTSRWDERNPTRELAEPDAEGSQDVVGYARLYDETSRTFGPPPATFYRPPNAGSPRALPDGERQGALFDLLTARRTIRTFDRDRPVALDDLATVLRYTFGCQGTATLSEDLVVQRKTSPSGGALHPVECYPLVVRVDGLTSGLYHYDVEHHGLSPLKAWAETEAEEAVVSLTAGQSYFRSAPVLLIMVARFYRNFWKYRGNSKAYKVLLMDAAHLSQTLYLVCTALGLGAFFTGAVSDVLIERALDLDTIEQGVIGVCGLGPPTAERADGALRTRPLR